MIGSAKNPDDCESLVDVRAGIDLIDRELVRLIARRSEYVTAAARYKTSAETVAAPERVKQVIESRKQWAAEEGTDPRVIEVVFSAMINYFISSEMAEWRRRKPERSS